MEYLLDKVCIIRLDHICFEKLFVDFLTRVLLRAQNTMLLSKVQQIFLQILWPSQKTQTWNVKNHMDTPCIPRFAWAISRNWRGGLLPLLFAKWIFLIGKQQKKRGLLHPPPLQIGEKYFLKEHPYFDPLAGPTMTTTVRPRDTRPQAARNSQVHVFELGPRIFEMHVFARFYTFLHIFSRFLIYEYLRYTIHLLNNTNLPMHGFLKILHY